MAFTGKGVCHYENKEYEDSLVYFKKALNLKRDFQHLFNIGVCYL